MDYQEVIELLKNANRSNDMVGILPKSDISKAIISSMQELQEYQKLGALEEVREAVEKQKWIPCSERSPENISTVIVKVKEIEKPTIGWYGNMSGCRLTERDFAELKDFTVIAWMPLPNPYREDDV